HKTLDAIVRHEMLERPPHYSQPRAVEYVTQAEAAVRPESEEKGEDYEHPRAEITEKLRERDRPAGGPEEKGESEENREAGRARADQRSGRAHGPLDR